MSDIKPIPGFWNGISQQAPAMRKENQAERQVNAYGTLVGGLEKRRGTNVVSVLSGAGGEAFLNSTAWTLDLGDNGVFLVLAVNDDDDPIQVYTLEGDKVSVTYGAGTKAYLVDNSSDVSAKSRIKSVTIGAKMYLVNTTVATAVSTTAPTITTKAITSIDTGSDVITSTAHGFSDGDRVQLVGATVEPAPLLNGRVYYVRDKTTDTFKVALTSGGTAIDITAAGTGGSFRKGSILAGTVQTFSDLPDDDFSPPKQVGDVYKIQGTDTSPVKWYVKWSGFVWEEHYNVEEASNAPSGTLMPVGLTYDSGDEGFDITVETWAGRVAGDATTNPPPSFNLKPITSVFFHRGRLGMLSGNNVIMSQVGTAGLNNFYPTSIIDVKDDDPIDISVSADNLDTLRSVKSHAKTLVVFGDRTQFAIHSGESAVLSVRTVAADPTTRFEIETSHQPFAAGSNILFLCETPSYLSVREYFVTEDTLSADAADVTIHTPRLIPNGTGQIEGINVLDIAFVRTSAEPTKIFVYKYYWVGEEKVQSSWSEWVFGGSVIAMTPYAKSLYLIIERNDVVTLESLDIEGDIDPTLGIHLHMDRKAVLTDGVDVTYDSISDVTTFELPYEGATLSKINLICPATSDVLHPHELTQDETNTELLYTDGDLTGAGNWIVGENFDMEYELSEFFLRNENGTAIQGGRLGLRRLWLEYVDTGYLAVDAEMTGRTARANMVADLSGNRDLITDYDTINTFSGEDKFPIFANSKMTNVTIKNPTFMPSNIVAGAWEFLFTPRVRPV